MKNLIYLLAVISLISCDDEDSKAIDSNIFKSNLLLNPSFEENEQSNAEFWSQHFPAPLNDSQYEIVEDASPSGGKYCMKLLRGMGVSRASQSFNLESGENVIKVSAWIKTEGFIQAGFALFNPLAPETNEERVISSFSSENWKMVNYYDTILFSNQDEVNLNLFPTVSEENLGSIGVAYYDNIKVEIIK